MNNKACLLSRRVVEQVVAMVKGRWRENPETDCDLSQAAGARHTQITVAVRLFRTLVSVCCLFAPVAMTQEEWQRQDRAGSHDFGVNSQRADTLAAQIPPNFQEEMKPEPETTSKTRESLADIQEEWGREDRIGHHDFAGQVSASQTAQSPVSSQAQGKPKQEERTGRRGSLVVVPLPISSPALGTGLVPVLGYIFPLRKNDKVSPPSVVGVAGLVTNNGTRGFAAYGDLFLRGDTYRITSLYVRGNLNYDLYGLGFAAGSAGRKLPLEQTGQVFRVEMLRRVGWEFFVGVRLWTGSSVIVSRLSEGTTPDVPPPPDLSLHTTLRALGLRLNRETSPNRFYPTTGTLLDFTSDFFSQSLGSKYTFQAYRFTFNKYGSLSKNQVLAYNLVVCGTGGTPPFYANCIYGASNELRGYTAGRYLDRYMFATQLEYRLTLPKRFGVVGFGGIGQVMAGGSQVFRNSNFLPAGGGGLRFQVSKKYRLNLRADIARGKDTWTWGMGVGEAF